MSAVLTGNDTVSVGSRGLALRILKDFGDGDIAVLDFPNELVGVKVGKNGNTIFSFNATGKTVNMSIRVLKGSEDDKYLNSEMNKYLNDPVSYILIDGEFIKRTGDGEGNVTNDLYRVSGGMIKKLPNSKENVEGDTEQAITVYDLIFANTDRSLT